MKIIYCMASLYNPGGMERVLFNKVTWLCKHGYDVSVVTTDQHNKPSFYPFPTSVRITDLGINYSDDNSLPASQKIKNFLQKRKRHKARLTALLMKEKADIVVSLYPSESSFIPKIKDGSKKILELHYNRYFRMQYRRTGLLGLADRYRTWKDLQLVRRFHKFVVLTQEDASYWGALPNLEVIPNAATMTVPVDYFVKKRHVVAVGRLDYQKSFDRLIEAWGQVNRSYMQLGKWELHIYGQGPWEEMLKRKAEELLVSRSVHIHQPVQEIARVYAESAFLVMSSHYEGLPMVMIEGMSCGLPVVSFDFPCGPKDLIKDGVNGFLVPEGDVKALARTMEKMMMLPTDKLLDMGNAASAIREKFSEEHVMQLWENCFKSILS